MKNDESNVNCMGSIRAATPLDIDQMVEIFRLGFEPELLKYTILGCKGIARFVLEHLTDEHYLFVVYVENDRVDGAAEFRRDATSIFLNHIYVRAAQQGKGIGRMLLTQGIQLACNRGQLEVGLDVFSNNFLAVRWYKSLGFRIEAEQQWSLVSLHPLRSEEGLWWVTENLEMANHKHLTLGFSQFNIITPYNAYLIGRLGSDYFRYISVFNHNVDQVLCRALYELDPQRELLVIGKPLSFLGEFKLLKISYRLKAQLGSVIANSKRYL